MSGSGDSSSPSSHHQSADMDSDSDAFILNDPVVQVMNLLNFSVVCRTDYDSKCKEIESLKLSLSIEKAERQVLLAKLEELTQFTSQLYIELANIFQRIYLMARPAETTGIPSTSRQKHTRRQRHILEIDPFQGQFETIEVHNKLKSLAENFQKEPCILNDINSLRNISKCIADCSISTRTPNGNCDDGNNDTGHPPFPAASTTQIQPSNREIEIIQLDEMPQNLEDSQQNLNLQLSSSLTFSPQQTDTVAVGSTEELGSLIHTEDTSKTSATMGYHCRCGFSCSIKPLLDSHIKCYNSKWKCDICNKRFMDKKLLDSHNTQKHKAAYPQGLKRVKHVVDTKSSKYRCDCGKSFFEKDLLMLHIASKGRL